jgi:omega-6 fatty acid desaturase (delta-12 desaturase)
MSAVAASPEDDKTSSLRRRAVRPARLRPRRLRQWLTEAGGLYLVSSIRRIKEQKRIIIREHCKSSDLRGLAQVLTTFGALALLWWAAVVSVGISLWLTVAVVLVISLFTLRVFALMHECGHGSLLRSQGLNRAFGFLLGVISGMPQYVWSQNHNFHHAHNGNWEKYLGPYTTLSVDEYAALSAAQQRLYRYKCSLAGAPIAGFIYLIFNPRFTWITGSFAFLSHIVRQKIAQPRRSLKEHVASFKSRYWKSAREYRHMCWNNLVLLTAWALMCFGLGTSLFFVVYLISLSLAGGAGIVLFTVQHNFRHAYASEEQGWDYDIGAIEGTSFLILPTWLNWFTANIGYHHIHHLSARIPNYRLIACHEKYRHLFCDVTRVKLAHVHQALRCILWDKRARQIISMAEYSQRLNAARGG